MGEDTKKIGVVTLYGNGNMGNRLQTYAVMRLYRPLGYEASHSADFERCAVFASALKG